MARSRLWWVLAAMIAGCGSPGEVRPDEVALEFVRSTDPSKCRLLTLELLERQTGRRGDDALRFCERNVAGASVPADVELIEAEVLGGKALVEIRADDREESLELVRREDGWRIYATR
ncbi:MAG: hypothetical protein WKF94_14120 [Solirubrobacteraceae bacterium]